jgi:hypothetical protein
MDLVLLSYERKHLLGYEMLKARAKIEETELL